MGWVFLRCGCVDTEGDAMRDDYFFLGWLAGLVSCFLILTITGAI